MKYLSTRNPDHLVSLSEALRDGLAPDGGLYVPETLPHVDGTKFVGHSHIRYIAEDLLAPFFAGDPLAHDLGDICDETFDFDIPLRDLKDDTALLELFHGPTAAFKDVGAGFLASCFSRLNKGAEEPLTVLVATSGDTGGAVAAAFHGKPNVNVVILYPKGKVSPRQEKQLTCWDGNVRTFGVHGVFDDCQRIVKEAFADEAFRDRINLTSANSINIGRLLPQMTYYAASSVWYRKRHGVEPNYVVPSGNLGNVLACLYARECGMPIGEVVLAVNENKPVVHFLETGEYKGFDTVATVANAMDVGDPSNMERLRHMWPDVDTIRQKISAYQVDDETIRQKIRTGLDDWGQVWDPHTACGVAVREQLDSPHWIVVSTAHPAKFDTVVEPLIEREVTIPDQLAELLDRPDYSSELDPSLDALEAALVD
ncbi:threonine synthase [Persicimonas caeni]|uniref:Threonine synthase n=1 Tax=Persicimonas caeni TaxID=2292766 RepID=A0A4Y6PRR2_PERCE|nr:threonine synthase [Persicimonas caeni]QDG51034.1 threonine synthase [Persicimonas caeni]QED32255.1 threonine synthase [Persicimonas caeni]